MASYAAAIREAFGVEVELEKGRVGQFDVVVNGETVATRKGGLWAKITGKPWPEIDDIVASVESAVSSA